MDTQQQHQQQCEAGSLDGGACQGHPEAVLIRQADGTQVHACSAHATALMTSTSGWVARPGAGDPAGEAVATALMRVQASPIVTLRSIAAGLMEAAVLGDRDVLQAAAAEAADVLDALALHMRDAS